MRLRPGLHHDRHRVSVRADLRLCGLGQRGGGGRAGDDGGNHHVRRTLVQHLGSASGALLGGPGGQCCWLQLFINRELLIVIDNG